MITIIRHGEEHYFEMCEECGCAFGYDKVDIKEYIENGEKIFKIRCPECGKVMDIKKEGENNAED